MKSQICNMVQQCAGCELPISDKFLLKVLDRVWHVKCVHCYDCKCALTNKCFSREGKLFCKNDFYRYVAHNRSNHKSACLSKQLPSFPQTKLIRSQCISQSKLVSYFEIFRRYGTKCAGCCLGISPNDMVRRAKHLVFHVKCFNCSSCNRQILTGDELYYVGESKFVCKEDYYQSRLPSKHSGEWKGNWFVY